MNLEVQFCAKISTL